MSLCGATANSVGPKMASGGSGAGSANATPSPSVSPSKYITVVDVYDLAAAIGKDFEHLIRDHGTDAAKQVMPKVITALETLEALAAGNERENQEIATLSQIIDRLEHDKQTSKEAREKFERELEQIEENNKKETQELWAMVESLQADNRRLSAAVDSHADKSSPVHVVNEDEIELIRSLKASVEAQRDQIKAIQTDCADKTGQLEQLQTQVDRLARANKELGRKNRAMQQHGRSLVEEKSELVPLSDPAKEAEIQKPEPKKDEAQALQDRENMPRFSLNELRSVLHEKNELKAKVLELEERLENMRPSPAPSPRPGDDELVVYGPMPREPDEKLHPWKYQRRESGVRKLLSKITGLSSIAGISSESSTNASQRDRLASTSVQMTNLEDCSFELAYELTTDFSASCSNGSAVRPTCPPSSASPAWSAASPPTTPLAPAAGCIDDSIAGIEEISVKRLSGENDGSASEANSSLGRGRASSVAVKRGAQGRAANRRHSSIGAWLAGNW